MKLKDTLEGNVVTLELSGKVIPGDELTKFHGKVHYYLDLHKTNFIIDLGGVDWISSAGLGALIAGMASVKKAGGKFVLTNVGNIQSLLNVTQLVRVFDIYDSHPAAVAAVGQ